MTAMDDREAVTEFIAENRAHLEDVASGDGPLADAVSELLEAYDQECGGADA